jgi:hypothetical protein
MDGKIHRRMNACLDNTFLEDHLLLTYVESKELIYLYIRNNWKISIKETWSEMVASSTKKRLDAVPIHFILIERGNLWVGELIVLNSRPNV